MLSEFLGFRETWCISGGDRTMKIREMGGEVGARLLVTHLMGDPLRNPRLAEPALLPCARLHDRPLAEGGGRIVKGLGR